jgi:hypothetical protein
MNTENSMAIENSVSVRLSNVFGLQVVQWYVVNIFQINFNKLTKDTLPCICSSYTIFRFLPEPPFLIYKTFYNIG